MMKKKFLKAATMVLLVATLFSCRKETAILTTESNNSPESILTGRNTSLQNTGIPTPPVILYWKIVSYTMDGNDLSLYYKDFNFQFLSDNLVIAIKGEITVYGKWYTADKDHVSLYFNAFNLPVGNLNDLNGDWNIIQITARSMYLTSGESINQKELRLYLSPKGGSL